ncbi:MAG: hypothetical protein ACKVJK_21835, partial [Methylophagaceae bacterium]
MSRSRDLASRIINTATGGVLTLRSSDTTITDGSVLGKLEFNAPDEGSGTDALLVGAAIHAVAEGTFTASSNASELVFMTGASEAATSKMVLSSAGALAVTGVISGAGFTAGNAVIAEAELELLDGLTAGTAIASKVVTTDANIDTSGQRNLTISGELDAATGDFSGAVDVAGAFTNGSTLVSTGKITADAGIDIDNFNIDGTTIALSSGNMTLDAAGTIILDANAGNHVATFNSNGLLLATDTIRLLMTEADGTQVVYVGDHTGSGHGAIFLYNHGGTATTQLKADSTSLIGHGLEIDGVATATTFEPDGDTAAGDNAAIGYTSAEGLILTGQGSTNDITIKNDADADVITIATGTTVVGIPGSLDIEGAIDVNGTTNLDVVDIDGAVNIAAATTIAAANKIQFRDTGLY